MALFGSDARVNATFTATDRATPVVKRLRSEVSALGSKTGGPLGGVLSGVSGLSIGMLGLVTAGVGAVGVLGDFAKKAIDDQASVDHLTASLKANVPAWNGQTAAIDTFIQKGQDLAFTDDDIRDSIAQLITRTHDVGQAMNLTREAMDLARLKGISLADASAILGKVFDGQTSAAKRAGIAIDDNATSTQALAQIQQAASGQAETYGKSQAGTLAKINIQWSEMTESLGRGVLDVLNGIGQIGTAFDNLHRTIDPNYKLMQDTDAELRQMAQSLGLNADEITAWIAAQKRSRASTAASTKAMHENDLAAEIAANNAANLTSNIGDLTNKYAQYGLTVDDVIRVQNQVNAGTYKSATAVEVNAAAHAAAAADIHRYIAAQQRAAAADKRRQGELAALQRQLDGLHDRVVHVNFDYTSNRTPVLAGGRAGGGPVSAGRSYLVGEHGPEVVHMGGRGGYVTQGRGTNSSAAQTGDVYLDSEKVGRVLWRAIDKNQGLGWNTTGSSSSRN